MADNKRALDALRRRIQLDTHIGENGARCEWHGQWYYPLCRSIRSDYYCRRHCAECRAEAESERDWAEVRQEQRERWAWGRAGVGLHPKGAGGWARARAAHSRRAPQHKREMKWKPERG